MRLRIVEEGGIAVNTEKKSPTVAATIKQEKDKLIIEFGSTRSILTKDSLIINVK